MFKKQFINLSFKRNYNIVEIVDAQLLLTVQNFYTRNTIN